MLMVLVIVDLGRAVYYYSSVHNAAREGARAGVVLDPDDPLWGEKVEEAARQKAVGLHTDRVTVTSNLLVLGAEQRDLRVEVTVEYGYKPVSIIIARMFGLADPSETVTLGSRSTMKAEW